MEKIIKTQQTCSILDCVRQLDT